MLVGSVLTCEYCASKLLYSRVSLGLVSPHDDIPTPKIRAIRTATIDFQGIFFLVACGTLGLEEMEMVYLCSFASYWL